MRIGVVGLGLMGEPIARRLLDAGHELTVFNRTRSKADRLAASGVLVAASPAEVWLSADACITVMADDDAFRAVTLGERGLLSADARDRVLVDMSTVSVDISREVAERAEGTGIAYLRAPVTGNPSVVEAGNLGIMVSGSEPVLRELEPVLRDIGPNLFYLGPGEEARVMKLALNLIVAGTTELLAEALVLGEASGLERAAMLEVMGASAVGSPYVKYKTAALVADDYSTTFTVALMSKDLALALETADRAGVPLPAAALVQQLYQACISSGLGELDLTALVPRLRREAGLS
jgi:3-hydroxyisobutyrate dehydrogenase-like beta-hydroxyacid dehydrogenase